MKIIKKIWDFYFNFVIIKILKPVDLVSSPLEGAVFFMIITLMIFGFSFILAFIIINYPFHCILTIFFGYLIKKIIGKLKLKIKNIDQLDCRS